MLLLTVTADLRGDRYMVWYNEGDIERVVSRTAGLSAESRRRQAARLLSAFKDVVNANSDGWCYWALASKSATGLIAILESNDPEPNQRAFNAAVGRVKTLCTKYKLPFPTGWDEPEKPVPWGTWTLACSVPLTAELRERIANLIREGFIEGDLLEQTGDNGGT